MKKIILILMFCVLSKNVNAECFIVFDDNMKVLQIKGCHEKVIKGEKLYCDHHINYKECKTPEQVIEYSLKLKKEGKIEKFQMIPDWMIKEQGGNPETDRVYDYRIKKTVKKTKNKSNKVDEYGNEDMSYLKDLVRR